jgi:hypothetical protein
MSGAAPARDEAREFDRTAFFETLQQRFRAFPVPADKGNFDPSKASQEELLYYGLPPRPDPRIHPQVSEIWQKGFGKPLILEAFSFTIEQLLAVGYRPFFRQTTPMLASSRYETSLNWSGAFVSANRFKKFMQIWGIWTVPNSLKRVPVAPPLKDRPFQVSVWVGLDGQRRYLNSSLPQIGTMSTYDETAPGYTTAQAWTQWWDRENPDKTLPVPLPLAVDPGDCVMAHLTAVGPQLVHLCMVNLTKHHCMAVWASSPSVRLHNGLVVPLEISGATAEWIVERPMIPCTNDFANFPDYPPTKFEACVALEADEVNIFYLPTARVQELRGERLIRMYAVDQNPSRIAFTSMPQRQSATSVLLQHGDVFPPATQ